VKVFSAPEMQTLRTSAGGDCLSMPTLDLKTNHKAVKEYYAGL